MTDDDDDYAERTKLHVITVNTSEGVGGWRVDAKCSCNGWTLSAGPFDRRTDAQGRGVFGGFLHRRSKGL